MPAAGSPRATVEKLATAGSSAVGALALAAPGYKTAALFTAAGLTAVAYLWSKHKDWGWVRGRSLRLNAIVDFLQTLANGRTGGAIIAALLIAATAWVSPESLVRKATRLANKLQEYAPKNMSRESVVEVCVAIVLAGAAMRNAGPRPSSDAPLDVTPGASDWKKRKSNRRAAGGTAALVAMTALARSAGYHKTQALFTAAGVLGAVYTFKTEVFRDWLPEELQKPFEVLQDKITVSKAAAAMALIGALHGASRSSLARKATKLAQGLQLYAPRGAPAAGLTVLAALAILTALAWPKEVLSAEGEFLFGTARRPRSAPTPPRAVQHNDLSRENAP